MGKFTKGQKVLILGPDRSHRTDLEGKIGTVHLYLTCHEGVTAVAIPGEHNPRSSHNVFYFEDRFLRLVKAEETNISEEDTIMLNHSSVVTVSIINNGQWTGKNCACYGLDLKENDLCVVNIPGAGLFVASVDAVHAPETVKEPLTAEVVDKVDETAFKARVEQRKLEKELKAKMAERAKKLQDIVLYETLAKSDPEMQQLLDQFKAVNGF